MYAYILDTSGDSIGPCGGTGASYIDLSDGPVKVISPGYTTIPEPITANLEHCRYQVEAPEGMVSSFFLLNSPRHPPPPPPSTHTHSFF